MNIFYTDHNPILAANLPDKHVVKMPVETVQMLVSALNRHNVNHNVLTKTGNKHKGGYSNHPCTIWAGNNQSNFKWLLDHGFALCQEYTKRYNKIHFAAHQLNEISKLIKYIPKGMLESPILAMPDELKDNDPITAYRNYIQHKINEKPNIFVWGKGTKPPDWLVLK